MKSFYLQITKKMVAMVGLFTFACLQISCRVSLPKSMPRLIGLHAQFDKDTVSEGDTLALTLTFRNLTADSLKFYPLGQILLLQLSEDYMNHYYPEKMFYTIHEGYSYDSVVVLKTNGEYVSKFRIPVKGDFFNWRRNNKVNVLYRFDDLRSKKAMKKGPILFCYSQGMVLYVTDRGK